MLLAILRTSHLVKAAIVGLLVGAGFLAYGSVLQPAARDALVVAEGKVTGASVVTRTSQRHRTTTRHYEIVLRPDGSGEDLRLSIPDRYLSGPDVRGTIGQRLHAEYAATDDVYVLRANGRELIAYETRRDRRRGELRQHRVDGAAIMAGSGLLLLLAGGFTAWRLRRRPGVA